MGELAQILMKVAAALLTCGMNCCMEVNTIDSKQEERRQIRNDVHIEDNGRKIDISITVPVKRKDTPMPTDMMEEIDLND
jgi:hypothetical protein